MPVGKVPEKRCFPDTFVSGHCGTSGRRAQDDLRDPMVKEAPYAARRNEIHFCTVYSNRKY